MTLTLVLLAIINSYVFWTAALKPLPKVRSMNKSGVMCASYAYKNMACKIFPWVHLVLYSALPAVLLITFNTLILIKLFKHRKVGAFYLVFTLG